MRKTPEKLQLSNILHRNKIISYLNQGKVGLFPTDTVYGICCRMDKKSAVERIFDIKKRDRSKPFLVLADSLKTAERYIELDLDPQKKSIIDKYWPGALTIAFKAKPEKVFPIIRASKNTIAFRVPDYSFLTDIIAQVGVPIVAPSANISGKLTPHEFEAVDKRIVDNVDFIVVGECKMGIASTIIDFSEKKVNVIREGSIKVEL